jgi:hypothetical protein
MLRAIALLPLWAFLALSVVDFTSPVSLLAEFFLVRGNFYEYCEANQARHFVSNIFLSLSHFIYEIITKLLEGERGYRVI